MFNIIVASSAGLLVLLGYFFPILAGVRDLLLQWAVILAGFALLVGVINLLSVHFKKLRQTKSSGIYSLVLILSFVGALVVFGFSGPNGSWSLLLFNSVQVSIESTLMALLAVVLLYAAIRLFRKGVNRYTILFLITVIVMLLGSAPFYGLGDVPVLSHLREWIAGVPMAGGARGILLGVALGSLTAGLRVLMGFDRPYNG